MSLRCRRNPSNRAAGARLEFHKVVAKQARDPGEPTPRFSLPKMEKQLENENARLIKIVVDLTLDR